MESAQLNNNIYNIIIIISDFNLKGYIYIKYIYKFRQNASFIEI